MDPRTCKMCGRLFHYIRSPFCPDCAKEIEEKFKQVKEYLYDHPGAGMEEVSEENDVSTAIIQYWIKEERLDFSEDSPVSFACEKCGMPIRTGRFCKKCKSEMQKEFQKMYAVEPMEKNAHRKSSAKMRFLDHGKDS